MVIPPTYRCQIPFKTFRKEETFAGEISCRAWDQIPLSLLLRGIFGKREKKGIGGDISTAPWGSNTPLSRLNLQRLLFYRNLGETITILYLIYPIFHRTVKNVAKMQKAMFLSPHKRAIDYSGTGFFKTSFYYV